MSKQTIPQLLVEWAPKRVRVYDPVLRQTNEAETLAAAMPQLGSQRPALFALGRRSAFLRSVRVPDSGRAEIEQILALQIGQHFPVAPHELAYDFLLGPKLEDGSRQALLGAVKIELLKQMHEDARQAGVKVQQVVPLALGSRAIASLMGLTDALVIEPGQDEIGFDLIQKGELVYSRAAVSSSISLEDEIERTFAAAETPAVPVIVAGRDTPLGEYRTTAATSLESLGGQADLHFDLELPEVVALRKTLADRKQMLVRLAVATVAGLAAIMLYLDKLNALDESAAAQSRWQIKLQAQKRQMGSYTSRIVESKKTQDVLDRAFHPAQTFSDMLTLTANRLPADVWLNGITLERGKPLNLRGTATSSNSVADYLQKLNGEQRFRDMKLIFANKSVIDTANIVNFSMAGHAIGNVPLEENTKKR